MGKLGGMNFNKAVNNSGNGLKAKIERNIVAIVNEKGFAMCTNGTDICAVYQRDSIVDSALEALTDLLISIPDNTEELLNKPFRVILPQSIGGLATGSFIDWVRTGKTITKGETMPKERLESFANIMKLMASKYANVELVSDRHQSQEDRKVTDPAWKTLKEEISKAVRGTGALAQGQAKAPEMSAEDKARVAELKAKLAKLEDELLDAETEEDEQKIENKIAKVQSMIARTLANAGQKEETAEETAEKPQVASDIAGLFA